MNQGNIGFRQRVEQRLFQGVYVGIKDIGAFDITVRAESSVTFVLIASIDRLSVSPCRLHIFFGFLDSGIPDTDFRLFAFGDFIIFHQILPTLDFLRSFSANK